MNKSVTGFSFANLGFFYGFGNGIYNAVYSLVLLELFHQSSAMVGVYTAIFAGLSMLFTLLSSELFKIFSKAQLFFAAMLITGVVSFMMGFPVKTATFISLDLFSTMFWILISMCIPLFLADFATKQQPLAKLNGRYHLWLNIGALIAPIISLKIADAFGVRSSFFGVAAVMMSGFFLFNYFKIRAAEKPVRRVSARRSMKSVMGNIGKYFSRSDLVRAYIVNFGYYALSGMRKIYIPIMVVTEGFSKDTLGIVLTVGIIPFILLSDLVARWASKTGSRLWLNLGFVIFAAVSFLAYFAQGYFMLVLMVAMMFAQAFQEPVHDLIYFDAVKKQEQSRFMGIFRTTSYVSGLVAPLLGAAAISMFGGKTNAVWLITGIIAILSFLMLIKPVAKSGNK